MKYRADIDGLRAIAVLSVVFNHAGIQLFHGGFIGVDVFFVISGYLITGIIIRELDANEFSLAKFYERRIRRIYPALFATILFTLVAGAFLYNANNFRDLGKSVVATTFFISNIHFWTQTGYFDGPAQFKPLLHTWSLAVEEQYYIVFPLLLLLLARYFRSRIPLILTWIALFSFAWNIYTLYSDPSAAFYFAHLRAWELLIGSLLALNFISINAKPAIANTLSLTGLCMIILPTLLYSADTPFPGFAAAIPVFGTALIIYTGSNNLTFIKKILSNPPLVFIGKISYSLYLWHWPLIIFAKYYTIKMLTLGQLAGLLFFILLISTLSWKFIETPFRDKKTLKGRNIFIYAGAVMALAAITGSIIHLKKGFARPEDLSIGESRTWSSSCNFSKTENLVEACPIGNLEQEPSFLLWGDSHARVAGEGISLAASQQHLGGQLIYFSGCPAILSITRGSKNNPCEKFNNLTIKYIEEHPEFKTIILAGRWAIWAEGTGFSFMDNELQHFRLRDTLAKGPGTETNAVLFERGLERTITKLLELDRKVVIISQVPEIGYNVKSANYIAQRTGRDTNELIAVPLDTYRQRNHTVFAVLGNLSKKYDIQLIDPWKALCNNNLCMAVVDKQSLYSDDHHLSVFGSEYISSIYDQLFQELALHK